MSTGRDQLSCNQDLIKVVDFKPFLDGEDKQTVANALLDSFKTSGFVYLVNHGLSQEKIDGMFELVGWSSSSWTLRTTIGV
jgi:isopenicillin N synthase-like dioxygenase